MLVLLLLLQVCACAVWHECIPFHKPSTDPQIFVNVTRNTSLLIYNYPLVLYSNVPTKFTDIPIHFYDEMGFTVCGTTQFRGHYCDEFGQFTLRSTKRFSEKLGRVGYTWRDTLEEKYEPMVAANEFIMFDDGYREYSVPYEGVWCVAVYQDGHYGSNMESDVRWRQSFGMLSVVEWREYHLLTVVCFVEMVFLYYLTSKEDKTMAAVILNVLCYHSLWKFYLFVNNIYPNVAMGAVCSLILAALHYYCLHTVWCFLYQNINKRMKWIFITKAMLNLKIWSHSPIMATLNTVTDLVILYHAFYESKEFRKIILIVTSIFLLKSLLPILQMVVPAMKIHSEDVSLVDKMDVVQLELLSHSGGLSFLGLLSWDVLIAIYMYFR